MRGRSVVARSDSDPCTCPLRGHLAMAERGGDATCEDRGWTTRGKDSHDSAVERGARADCTASTTDAPRSPVADALELGSPTDARQRDRTAIGARVSGRTASASFVAGRT